VIEAACGVLLLAGSLTPLPWPQRRYLHYTFVFVAIASFLAIGPRVSWIALAAAVFGAVAQVMWTWLRGAPAPALGDRVRSLLATGLSIAIACVAADLLVRALGMSYPVPTRPPMATWRLWAVVDVVFVVVAAGGETAYRLSAARDAGEGEAPPRDLGSTVYAYVIGAILCAPLQYAAQALFDADAPLPWLCALAWGFLLHAVLAMQIERRRRIAELTEELATKERLAAVGEMAARIAHQTRHQLGLIGITVHRIDKRVSSLTGDDGRVVREELAKLGEVQRELSDMLVRELRASPGEPHGRHATSYADIVQAVARRLDALAVSRGVRLELGELDVARGSAPADADNVSHAVFNVLENALVAARSSVRVTADARDARLVIAIADDGPGMRPSVLARAAQPFVTTKVDGTGMGLAIARAAVQSEGGALRIGDDDAGGCRVEIDVPAR